MTALRYRWKTATFTRTGDGLGTDEEGAWASECLRGIVATAGVILSKNKVAAGGVVQEIGDALRALHMDSDGINAYFG